MLAIFSRVWYNEQVTLKSGNFAVKRKNRKRNRYYVEFDKFISSDIRSSFLRAVYGT